MPSLKPSLTIAACLLAVTFHVQSAKAGTSHKHAEHAFSEKASTTPWWKHALIYEIYPRSFQDTDGNGIGDLNGITKRLGYLQHLGVNAIWLTPVYPSPQVDFGYDISNYKAIDPMYGSMADFNRLLAKAKNHHVRVIMDMVLNHTSDKSKWFQQSASSRNNPKADWYVWNSGIPANKNGVSAFQKRYEHNGKVPPNNWESLFGGSAWQWVPARKQFYYHMFYKQQPDLNWHNPEVRKAMYNVVRFWLKKGVAGFRLDAIDTLFEDPKLRNAKVSPGKNDYGNPNISKARQSERPGLHKVLRKLRKIVDSYPGNRVLVGEIYTNSTRDLLSMYGLHGPELQLPMDTRVGFINKLNANKFRQRISAAENKLKGHMPLFVFDNHDNPRSWNRYADGKHNEAIAKGLATILLTTRSAALMYYGQEIGMVTTPPKRKADCKDPICIEGWPKEKGRDGERTPMQWTPGPQAGFSNTSNTWLPIPPSYKTINVKTEGKKPHSLFNWYKKLITLRSSNPTLHTGGFKMLNENNKNVLSYMRTPSKGGSPVVAAINMSAQPQKLTLDLKAVGVKGRHVHTLATSAPSLRSASSLSITLPPFASWVAAVQ